MNEFELIGRLLPGLAQNASVVVPAGDDCAALDLGLAAELVLLKTDAVVEDIHFTADTPPALVGRKALARCLSDIAAMAGSPRAALVTLGLPRQWDPAWVEQAYAGLNELARLHQVAIVGGETTTNPGGRFLSVSVLGIVAKDRCLLRTGAQPGDGLFVTGQLGGSLAGRHLEFEPRLAEARWLAAQFDIHSMIDLSDGLAGDLPHLLKPGGLGAELLATAIPISRDARVRAREGLSTRAPLEAALSDGEDFELLFTLPARQATPLHDAWKTAFPGLKLSCIGKITAQPGVRIRTRNLSEPVQANGYVHFNES